MSNNSNASIIALVIVGIAAALLLGFVTSDFIFAWGFFTGWSAACIIAILYGD